MGSKCCIFVSQTTNKSNNKKLNKMEKYYYKGEQIWRTDFLNLIKKIGVKRNYNEPQWKSFIGAVKSGNKAAVALFRDIKIEINGFAIEM